MPTYCWACGTHSVRYDEQRQWHWCVQCGLVRLYDEELWRWR